MRFLLATWEGGGVVPPEMGVVRRLRARGHEVRVLADPAVERPRAVPAVSRRGFAPLKRSLAPDEDFLRDWEYKNLLRLFAQVLRPRAFSTRLWKKGLPAIASDRARHRRRSGVPSNA
jgi:hypothetical protein